MPLAQLYRGWDFAIDAPIRRASSDSISPFMSNRHAFITRWQASGASERANKDAFLIDLCDVIGVPRPSPNKGDPEHDVYVFERDARMPHPGGVVTIGKIDLFKEGCFILEAKQGSEAGSKKLGTAKRETPAWNIAMRDAYGQALGYARSFDKPPPFLVTCDLGYCFDLYATFDGSHDYRPFPNAQASRIFLRDLDKHEATLRAIFTDPHALDPSKQSMKVTREVAGYLANLAKRLEAEGHDAELVAKFLMRCLFTMFAEDVGLLPEKVFTNAIRDLWIPSPASFTGGVEALWRTMNEGGHQFGIAAKIMRFNGGLFAQPQALPLDDHALRLLLVAAECNWADVEPAIFGTLLERALDARERHLLGAHFTPRAYVERLVRPTIEDPLRADWEIVQAHVRQLVATEGKTEKAEKAAIKTAVDEVRAFHQKLCKTRVLDPACGSGNFLYVTLDLFKRLEAEVFALLESLGAKQTVLHMEGLRVTPEQFHGIEIKRWAKEIAELVLWIGYLQWHFRQYGNSIPVPEPVLRDYHNIECRDAVLAYDSEEIVRDEKTGKPVTRWDGVTMKKSPVTGEDVPDESAQTPIYRYLNPRRAEWPEAEFIVGNPPFLGKLRLLSMLGEGYVEALRLVYESAVPDSADFVMYWWHIASRAVASGKSVRFGFVTTNSITQVFNRRVVSAALESPTPVHLTFAIPDHPWVDSENGASVRIAMTVGASGIGEGWRLMLTRECAGESKDGAVEVGFTETQGVVHADLKVGANVSGAVSLASNGGLTSAGVMLGGRGFLLSTSDAMPDSTAVIKPIVSGADILQKRRDARVIDFYGRSAEQAQHEAPTAFQRVLVQVKPERDTNRRALRRDRWWLFSELMPNTRHVVQGLPRFIVTPETSKHRVFVFVPAGTLPEHPVLAIGLDHAFFLGVMSSRIHVTWALATGGRLGVGNDPRYNKTKCFEPFAFPQSDDIRRARIAKVAEEIDAHRKRQQAANPELTVTGMYNVVEKLRLGEQLTAKDKVIHEQGLVSVLKKLHDDLDAAVFDAYGWPHDLTDEQILERLVALNKERADEERRGIVRWLRPEFQNPSETKPAMAQVALTGTEDEADEAAPVAVAIATWPKKLPEQIFAVREIVVKTNAEHSASDVARAFKGAKEKDAEEVLDGLAALGLLVSYELPEGKRYRSAAFVGRG